MYPLKNLLKSKKKKFLIYCILNKEWFNMKKKSYTYIKKLTYIRNIQYI